MFKVELKLNNQHFKSIAFAKPITIREIIKSDGISKKDIVAYKQNNEYVDSSKQIFEDTKIDCVSYDSSEGYLIYQDTTIFILMNAFYNIFSTSKKLVVEHSVGDGVFCEIFEGEMLTEEDIIKLKKEMNQIISQELPIEKYYITSLQAEEIFTKFERDDILKNLQFKNIDVYKCGQYYDYYLRQLADNTSIISSFDIIYHSPGLILRFPRRSNRKIRDKFILPKDLFTTHQEHDKWLNILNVHNISALNRAIRNYQITDLIQIEEALHEKKIVNIANEITLNKDVKIVLIAGPSSSGKTTFAKRLSIQLIVNGISPHIIHMDDYFLPRKKTPLDENGDCDLESINAVNLDLLNKHLKALLIGEEIELPKFNFLTGQSENSYKKLKLGKSDILILEGIHGLNDQLTSSVPFNQKSKIYVSALNNLNIDAHNRIRTSDSRKIRRIVRDHNFRGHTAEQTLEIWDSVREGENKNIFPFQENADFMFNSILTYELGVLKKYIEPLLQNISKYSNVYIEAESLLLLFDHVNNIEDHLVPSNSILKEFIGISIPKY